jgi:hypothetical protein
VDRSHVYLSNTNALCNLNNIINIFICATGEDIYISLLCAHANEILERNFALKAIWVDDNYFNARSMDVYITKLRKHLKDDPEIEIINIHGKGYKLIAPDVEQS